MSVTHGKTMSVRLQLLRYGLVGVASNLAAYLAYLLLTRAGAAPKLAMTMLYLVGATVSFFGNRRLTFSFRGGWLGPGVRYALSHAVGYLINLALLVALVDAAGYPHQWVQALAILVVAAYLFLAMKFFVFRKES